MRLFRRPEITGYDDVFQTAASIPYNWASVVGHFMGINNDMRFGGACIDKSKYVLENLPRNTASYLWDRDRNHFALLINNKDYYDPTYYQYSINSTNSGNTSFYPTLIVNSQVRASKIDSTFSVQIEHCGSGFDMRKLGMPAGVAMNYVYESVRSYITYPPYISYSNDRGCETRVILDTERLDLKTKSRGRTGEWVWGQNIDDMEFQYGFTPDELLNYFVSIWSQVRRYKNLE